MPPPTEPPLISKKYIYMVPVIVVGLGLNLAFNREARDLVGLKPGGGLKLTLFQRKGAQPPAAVARKSAFTAEEFRAFTESFTQHEVAGLYIPPPPQAPPDPGEDARKRAEEEARRERERIAYLWPVPVQGAFRDMHGRWTAIVSGQNVRISDSLASDVPGRCGYSVLAIGWRCAWMQVIPPGEAVGAAIPDIDWPDVALIELDRTGLIRREYVPARVRLGNGVTLGKGDVLEYRATGTRFIVKYLWHSGVVFEAVKDDKRVEFACALVTP